ncbi:hypothetical protein J5Y04_24300 [Kitasatospora sp. RG8]|uniref:hypothetical protein n=1 Tax=Kitasatospora sp. RG8 TaxID=2820815 RepID=UPI001AE03A3F|nr:hypothetical protein [Kitasatospora sp. RG8]MBP0452640.1 hypothetical protein [Kitasatospora sp. RG8]
MFRITRKQEDLETLGFKLLDDLPAWRVRSVEQVELTTAQLSKRERVIHVKPLREVDSLQYLLRKTVGRGDSATLIIPIVNLPRFILLDFNITIDGNSAYRFPRKETGEFEARYIRHLATEAKLSGEIDGQLEEFMAAAFTFPGSALEAKLMSARKKSFDWRADEGDLEELIRKYVKDDFGPLVSDRTFERWQHRTTQISNLVRRYTPKNLLSASENPLLALPQFMRNHNLTSRTVSRMLARLCRLLTQAHEFVQLDEIAHPDNTSWARKFMRAYSSYGQRWEVLTKCSVPLNEPFIIQVSDKRPIFFDPPGRRYSSRWPWLKDRLMPTARQYVSFADARTNHFHIRVPDEGVEFVPSKCLAMREDYMGPADKPSDENKEKEHYSRYDAKVNREKRIWIDCRLRLTRLRLSMFLGLILATLLAVAMMVSYGFICYNDQHKLNGSDVVAILIPVTFAASLLIVKETTTLTMHVKRAYQAFLMSSLLALWVLTFILYVMGRISIDGAVGK